VTATTVFLMAIGVYHTVNVGQGGWMHHAVPSAPYTQLGSLAAVPSETALLVASLALTGATIVFILLIRSFDQDSRDAGRITYELEFPRDLTLDSVTAFMRSLTSLRPRRLSLLGRDSVVFETITRPGEIRHRLRVSGELAEAVLPQLRAAVPAMRVWAAREARVPAVQVIHEIRLGPHDGAIRTDEATGFATGLLAAMQPLVAGDHEAVIYQLVVYPVRRPGPGPTQRSTSPSTDKTPSPTSWRRVWRLLTRPEPAAAMPEAKVAEPWLALVGRVGAVSTGRGRSGHLVDRVVGQLRQLDRSGVHFWTRSLSRAHGQRAIAVAHTPIVTAPMHVNAREVATLIGWPLGGPTLPGLKLSGGRVFPPPQELPSTGLVVGQAVYSGLERPIGVAPADVLMHMLVSGPTGSGKSTFLLNLVKQGIDAGTGLILIDPNGDLAGDVINCITADRVNDLIFINPGDLRPLALNPLACAFEDAELVADQLLSLIRDRADSWGVTIDEALRNTLVLLAARGLTLVEVGPVLVDAGLRRRLLTDLDQAFMPVSEYFARFESWNPAQQAQTAAAVMNKITPLVDRRPIRAMLGQAEPTWTMQQVFDEGKILVASLPSGVIGPVAADLVGGVLLAMAWNAGQGRIAMLRENRRPVSLVVDELPRFSKGGSDLPDILARARAHGLGLVGAIQHIGQVPPMLRSALLSEARNKVILQPTADDAGIFARHMPGVNADDLLTLEARTAIASLVVGGRVTAPVSIATFPPPEPTGHGQAARMASRLRYGRDRADVEQAIAERRRGPGPGPRRTRRLS